MEPDSGTTTVQVCMSLTVGALGQRVVVQPEWVPVTAQGVTNLILAKTYQYS